MRWAWRGSRAQGFGDLIAANVTAAVSTENLKFWRHTLLFWDNFLTHATQSMVYPNAYT
jgi:hypothetical protein